MERELIQWLREKIPGGEGLQIGIGDDAAVLAWQADRDLVVSTDLLVDRVHFDLASGVEPSRVGRKALAVNLSDLAAMAAGPVGAVVSVALPRSGGLELAKQLYEGLLPLAAEFDCLVVGGDTNSHDGPLVISVTVFGQPTAAGVWTRGGAQAGDRLLVTGDLGGSRLAKQFDFTPRVREALHLAERYEVHAAMDISDGLALDLSRMCAASGCGAMIQEASVPISAAASELSKTDGKSPLAHALSDGEDFELLLAVSSGVAKKMIEERPLEGLLTDVGEVTTDRELVLVDENGHHRNVEPVGFEHEMS